MPLYALDGMGRLYQTGGFDDNDMSVGRYADDDLGEQNNLYFGDLSNREARRMASHNKKKLARWKKHQAKLNQQRRIAQARTAQQNRIKKQHKRKLSAMQTRQRKRHQQKYLQAYKDGLNPMGAIETQLMGNPLGGFEEQGHPLMTSHAMANAILAGDVGYADDYGYDMAMGGWGKKLRRGLKKAVKKVVKKSGALGGKILKKTNPITITARIAKQLPIVKNVYKGVDKLSGGLLTSVERISKLPEKAVAGQKITKAEFMEAAMMALKIGAIVVTGGGAAAVIAASAGQLKGGPLGKTSFGRAVLSIGEVMSVASLGKQTMSKILEKKAISIAAEKAGSAVAKKNGVLGGIAASVAVSAGFAGLNAPAGATIKADANVANTVANNGNKVAEAASKGFIDKVKSGELKFDSRVAMESAQKEVIAKAKKEVSKEFEKKTGIPLDLAVRAAKGDIPTTAEIQAKVKAKVAQGLDLAKEDLNRTMSQLTNADATMKGILEKKRDILDQEIKKGYANVEKVKELGAKDLVAANADLTEKLKAANAQHDISAKLAAELKNATEEFERAGTTNVDAKNKLWAKVQGLTAALMNSRMKADKLADIAWDTSDKAKQIEDYAAVQVLRAELTPYGAMKANDFDHPLLSFGA